MDDSSILLASVSVHAVMPGVGHRHFGYRLELGASLIKDRKVRPQGFIRRVIGAAARVPSAA
jgi:hypothetical protein